MVADFTDEELSALVSQFPSDLTSNLTPHPPDTILHAVRYGHGAIANHAVDDDPIECVGFLWDNGETTRLINQSRSSSEFSVGETQFLDAFHRAPADWELASLYHSHPQGSPYLSPLDLSEMRRYWGNGIRLPWTIISTDGYLYTWFLDDDFQPTVTIYLPPFDMYFYGAVGTRDPSYYPWSPN